MEKEGVWGLNWQSADDLVPPELNSGSSASGQLPQCLLDLKWRQPMTHEADFQSALSGGRSSAGFPAQFGLPETPGNLSRVSSSKSLMVGAASRATAPETGDEVAMLSPAQMEMELMSKICGSLTPEDSELGNGQDESSVSDRVTAEASSLRGVVDSNARKRKAAAKGKGKAPPLSSSSTDPPYMTELENSDAKRCKLAESNGKNSDAKPPEPPKDYIHVRARRGQATDAHSLAERVRREKISKRMKFLQDLVPGCNKVTGKAVMLDEIINYVQSLQRQVEFLSMKLATMNPQLDNMELLIPKLMYQAHGTTTPQPLYPVETTSLSFSYAHRPQAASGLEAQFSMDALESSLSQPQNLDVRVAAVTSKNDMNYEFWDQRYANLSQVGDYWEDDLHSVAQLGLGQNQEAGISSQGFHSQIMHANNMKIEL
ncbi:hypothetical protein C4D60_Mb03t02230 [Musa balbisiana]|uniref:BHLH domain-containing protein n=1 Tax=Musa balbisiana TaxID=52838 RepID=A0A4V4H5T9_MUSBA|nr:hypothetical protein C4D60_Mb03t02230 [Musa balbisiana]